MGAVLAVVGVLLQIWWLPSSPRLDQSGPLNGFFNDILYFVPTFGILCSTVGAVMVALALFIGLGGHAPVPHALLNLLWLGLGLVVVVTGIEYFLLSSDGLYQLSLQIPMRLLHSLSTAVGLVHLLGATLIGLGLTGLITSPRHKAQHDPENPALIESRPF
ncbi:hypothetical protein [Ornithinimicrobium murale]|uniref:hypothetical protein n=1 Tax=Ornithinimicrobium murale TaxID=1050153 RepID=UPI0013B35B68|nr:hypothetical protein [Ornithinimicrobium murale]